MKHIVSCIGLLLTLTTSHAQQWQPLGPDDADINWPSVSGATYQSLKLDASGYPVVAYTDEAHGGRITVTRWTGSAWSIVGAVGFSAGVAYAPSLALDANGYPVVAFVDEANGTRATVMRWNGSTWSTVGNVGFSAGVVSWQSLDLDASGYPVVAYIDIANGTRATVMRWSGSSWNTVGAAGFSAGAADYPSLKLDAYGNPVIAYRDDANGGRTTVMRWNGSTWNAVGTVGFSAGAVDYLSLKLDTNGYPVVAYRDYANGQRATVMRWTGSAWSIVGVAGFSAGVTYGPSLAMDASGYPVVAYQDVANNSEATVMRWNGSTWNVVGAAGFSALSISYPSLALDASGYPVIAYRDDANNGRTTVMRWNGSTWNNVGMLTGLSAGSASHRSLALDASGDPVVAYTDNANGNRTTVMRWNGSTWNTVGTVGISAGTATFPSLAIDASGHPVVAYQDHANGQRTTVMRWNGSAWNTVGSVGFSAGTANFQSLAIDASDNPVVAYQDGANGQRITVMRWTGSAWSTVGTAGFSAGSASTPSLAVNADGYPVVAYRDAANGQRTTVMRWNGSAWSTVGAAGFSAGLATYQSLALDASNYPVVAYTDGLNLSRTTVMRWNGSTWNTVGTAGFPTGTGGTTHQSLALDTSGNPVVAFRDQGNGDRATVMRWDGSSWNAVGTPGFTAPVSNFNGRWLQLDAADNMVVAYASGPMFAKRYLSSGITTGTVAGPLCIGAAVEVPYTISGPFNTGNTFTSQLSDATGSFATPTTIGSVSATVSGSISATIPPATPAGTGYRIRVVSSDPPITGMDNGADITVQEPAWNAAPTLSGMDGQNVYTTNVCAGSTLTFQVFSNDVNAGQYLSLAWGEEIAGATFTTTNAAHPVGTFSWTPTISSIGTHIFTATVTDDACIPASNTFGYAINVTQPPTWYADADEDGHGDANTSIQVCGNEPPSGYVADNTDCNDTAPNLTAIGQACDPGPGYENGMVIEGCICVGTPIITCTENVTVELRTDLNSQEASWEILDQSVNFVVCSGGGYPEDITTPITDNCCLPAGCYRLRVMDSGGDGFVTGGYQLRESGVNGRRIIDNFGNFTTGSVSAISNAYDNGAFCVPIGDDKLIFSSCDKLDWTANKFIVVAENPAVSAQYNVTNATSGYEFWFYDPNGTYSFRRFRSHATSDGFGSGALRANHFKINCWINSLATPHLPDNVLLNVRVRGRVAGENLPFGQACLFKLDATLAACPRVKLQDDPANTADFSCGVTRNFGGSSHPNNRITANPPQPIPTVASSSVRYQFRFRIPGEGICIVRPPQTSARLVLNWTNGPALECSKTYEVDVRVSLNGGSTWCSGPAGTGQAAACADTGEWGKVCNVTINACAQPNGGGNSMTLEGGNTFTLYPNPNGGEQLFLSITGVEPSTSTATVDIYDLTGKRVVARTIAVTDGFVKTNIELDNALSNGVYVVHITAGTKTHTERLVIAR